MELVSVFGVVAPASMHGDRQSWIAIIESGAASAVKFSKARKAWAKEWSPAIRASWNPYGTSRALKIKGDRVKIGPAGLDREQAAAAFLAWRARQASENK